MWAILVSDAALALSPLQGLLILLLAKRWGLVHSGLIKGKLVGFQPRTTQMQKAVQQMALHLCHNLS